MTPNPCPSSARTSLPAGRRRLLALALAALALVSTSSCNGDDEEALAQLEQPRVEVYFNAPGTWSDNATDLRPSEILVERLDRARVSIDACLYGLSKQNVIDALIRAHYRGVRVRVVGDARHYAGRASGYLELQKHHIPMQLGNQNNIMHNKFFVIDKRFSMGGTGNITSTGFGRNDNHWVWIDSPRVAADFLDEFEQMWRGRFSAAKRVIDNGNRYEVGDTTVEVYFAPQEDAMGVILEEVARADHSIHFQIFAFTKDEVGSLFINKHRQWEAEARANDQGDLPPMEWDKKVVGVFDKSQLHGNGQYHESYRMLAFGVPARLDANENSRLPGDYQAGGGRLHTKTMILDAACIDDADVPLCEEENVEGCCDPRVLTGSFNWSSAATVSNDEHMYVLRGRRITEDYMRFWNLLWLQSKDVTEYMCSHRFFEDQEVFGTREPGEVFVPNLTCASEVEPGDVIISEVHWDGWNGELDPLDRTGSDRNLIDNDEFVELYNTTNAPIDLSMWSLTTDFDFKVGFTPGTIIMPGQYFLVVDHNRPPYSETLPVRSTHAFRDPDFVLNIPNDQRFPRLNLKNSRLKLQLRTPGARIIDQAGDGGPPFFGGRQGGNRNYSMERVIDCAAPGGSFAGAQRSCWHLSSGTDAPEHINDEFQPRIVATPGEPNSAP